MSTEYSYKYGWARGALKGLLLLYSDVLPKEVAQYVKRSIAELDRLEEELEEEIKQEGDTE